MLLFALVAVLPGALVYGVSVQFLGKSIESWFDVRVEKALEGGLNLGRSALDYLLKEFTQQGHAVALTLRGDAASMAAPSIARASRRACRRPRCSRLAAACSRRRNLRLDG